MPFIAQKGLLLLGAVMLLGLTTAAAEEAPIAPRTDNTSTYIRALMGAIGAGERSGGAIIPAGFCQAVNCDWAQAACFGSLVPDPFSCGS